MVAAVYAIAAVAFTPTATTTFSHHRPQIRTATAPPPRHPSFIKAAATSTTLDQHRPLAPLAPVAVFLGIHTGLRRALVSAGISFPAAIVGMLGGFGILCLIPQHLAANVEDFFAPANRLFRDWLAAIFAPGFIALPLTMPALAAADLGKFLLLIFVLFGVSVATNTVIASTLAPRRAIEFDEGAADLATPDAGPPPPPPNPFPVAQQRALVATMTLAAALHLLVFRGADVLALNLCLLCATLGSFSLASTLCSPAVKLYLHPFLTCSAATLGACAAIGAASGTGWRAALASYSTSRFGGGMLLSQLMGPTVLSFAFQLYSYRQQLRRRATQILGTAVLGSLVSMLTSAAAARLLGLAPVLRLALFGRSTISALAMEACKILGVEPPALGLLAAFLTGLLGLPLGKPLLARLKAKDPAVRGLALVGAAHGGGLLALSDEREAFPFAALMMNLSAACTVVLLSVPIVRRVLLAVALGKA